LKFIKRKNYDSNRLWTLELLENNSQYWFPLD